MRRVRIKARRAAIFGDNDGLDVFQRLCGTTKMLEMLRMLRCMIILDALERNKYNVRATAKEICVDVTSIYGACKFMGINPIEEKRKLRENKIKRKLTIR